MLWRSVGPRAAPSSSASNLNDLGGDGRWGTKKTSATVAFERVGRRGGGRGGPELRVAVAVDLADVDTTAAA